MKNIPSVFSEYIFSLEPMPVDFKECKSVQRSLSKDEAMRDFELLCYLIDNAYSGKEYWEKQSISFLERYKEVQRIIQKQEAIGIDTFCHLLCGIFSDVHDGHIYASHALMGQINFHNIYRAYFADILIEKVNDEYIVIKSNDNNVAIGDKIDPVSDNGVFFPTLSPKQKQHFLLGQRSWKPVQSMEVKINENIIIVQLHACKQSKKNDSCIFQYDNNGKHPIVKSSRFWESDNEVYEKVK